MPDDQEKKNNRKLAFIDDDEISHIIFKALIRRAKPELETETYCGTIEALNKIATKTFDASAIMPDISMPLMTGWDFLAELNTVCFDIPVYLLTSCDDRRDRSRAIEFPNVRDYFVKPLNLNHLDIVIKNHFLTG